ncbi:JAB domain-containing protein [Bacteroides caecigallinarum]|uniref:JAB domain-containing protein n=1 Tax=Bacteroides caecigallinarum TaxID=1411144 RepID=UPI001F43ABCF|nr:JAB domain-containing protein [Bacteroides caecigallinarum]MCF2592857.1 JAB domain-containing protein [Bacteroides caecigallinarum]
MCGECRHLSDAEVVYQITNSEKTSKEVEKMMLQDDNVTIEEICQTLTPARRAMAMAVIELYKRMQSRKADNKVIKCSEDIYNVMHRYLQNLDHEECWVIFLNQSGKVIRKQRVSVGGLASTQVDVRLILREALKVCATSLILVHNHPSGNVRPSADDDRLTMSLQQASKILNIKMLDHVIYTDYNNYSYADEGRL